jgi:hypothetical protein
MKIVQIYEEKNENVLYLLNMYSEGSFFANENALNAIF